MSHSDKVWASDFRREVTQDLRKKDRMGRRRAKKIANQLIRKARKGATVAETTIPGSSRR